MNNLEIDNIYLKKDLKKAEDALKSIYAIVEKMNDLSDKYEEYFFENQLEDLSLILYTYYDGNLDQ